MAHLQRQCSLRIARLEAGKLLLLSAYFFTLLLKHNNNIKITYVIYPLLDYVNIYEGILNYLKNNNNNKPEPVLGQDHGVELARHAEQHLAKKMINNKK